MYNRRKRDSDAFVCFLFLIICLAKMLCKKRVAKKQITTFIAGTFTDIAQ